MELLSCLLRNVRRFIVCDICKHCQTDHFRVILAGENGLPIFSPVLLVSRGSLQLFMSDSFLHCYRWAPSCFATEPSKSEILLVFSERPLISSFFCYLHLRCSSFLASRLHRFTVSSGTSSTWPYLLLLPLSSSRSWRTIDAQPLYPFIILFSLSFPTVGLHWSWNLSVLKSRWKGGNLSPLLLPHLLSIQVLLIGVAILSEVLPITSRQKLHMWCG